MSKEVVREIGKEESKNTLYLLVLDTTNSDSIKPMAQRYATWIGRQTGLPQKIFYDSEPLIKMAAEKAAKAMEKLEGRPHIR